MPIEIVIGAPCSGKTTYVEKLQRDVAVFDPAPTLTPDVEAIRAARSAFIGEHDDGVVTACRDFVCEKKHYVTRIDADMDTCLDNLRRSNRDNKDKWEALIRSFFKDGRKMPDMSMREYRYFTPMKPVDGDGAGCIVEGYATTFDDPYDFGPDGMKEVVRSDAFETADMSDVIFQYDHGGMVLARMRNGSLSIENDAHGMKVRADLGGCDQGRKLYESIENGLIDRMSWGFTVANDGWEYDKNTRTSTITKVDRVFDVSAVSIPANEGTEIKARSYLDAVYESEQQELLQGDEREERMRIAASLELTKGM